MSLNVSLPAELENRVREHVASGLYGSASEVIREALRLFEAYQATQASHLQALQADIHQGLADVQAERVSALDVDAIKQQGRQRLRQAKKIMSRVLFAESAKADLIEAWLFIAEKSVDAADGVIDAINQEAQTLSSQPLMGRWRSELAEGVRSWPTSTRYITPEIFLMFL